MLTLPICGVLAGSLELNWWHRSASDDHVRRTLHQDVVRRSPLHVRHPQPPARHDGSDFQRARPLSFFDVLPTPTLSPCSKSCLRAPALAVCLQDWAIAMRGRGLHALEQARAAWRTATPHRRPSAAVAKSRFFRRLRKIRFAHARHRCMSAGAGDSDVGPRPTHGGASTGRVAGGGEVSAAACRCAKVGDFAHALNVQV